jgi:hypothetical protein
MPTWIFHTYCIPQSKPARLKPTRTIPTIPQLISVVHTLSSPNFDIMASIRKANISDPELVALKDQITTGMLGEPWALTDVLLTFRRRVYLPPSSPLLSTLIAATHDNGHEGVQRTLQRFHRDFHTPKDRTIIQDYVHACAICQRCKTDHLHPGGLLMPLPVPTQIWSDIAMNFVEGLPKVGGKSVILTGVDRFSKYAHFIPLAHPYTAESVAQVFFSEIVRLHGIL